MEQTAREKILQRILNLRARAEDDGSSEAEMNTAFTMAMKLMDSYNVEEAELAIAENTGRIVLDLVNKKSSSTILKNKHKHKILSCLSSIARFTSTEVTFSTYGGSITFTGHRPDTELADYLTAVIRSALDSEYDVYRKANPRVGYGAKSTFQISMTRRINARLYEMVREREEKQEQEVRVAKLQIEQNLIQSSTALVVKELAEQKKIAVDSFFAKSYPRLRTVNTSFNLGNNNSAYVAGSAAGNRVNLGRAISQGSTKMIGAN